MSWNWGGGAPGGTVAETKTEGELAITTKRGNKVKKNAEPDNPAVRIERSGNDVVKKASELNVEEKANGANGGEAHDDDAEKKAGEKRKHDEVEDGDKKEEEAEKKEGGLEENADGKTVRTGGKTDKAKPAAKKQKKDDKEEEKTEEKPEKKKAGRPKKAEGASSKSKKDPTPRAADGIGSRTRSRQKAS